VIRTLATLLISMLLAGCAGHRPGYPLDYRQALADTPDTAAVDDAGVQAFIDVYQDLKGPALAKRLASVYAEQLYFSDTLHVFRDLDSLTAYMEETARRVDSIEIRIDRVLRHGNDVWLRWDMRTEARALGRTMRADTIGMTHLRFNTEGKVVLHQDYWDSTEGLYIHIPVVGGLVRWTRNRL
jgi:hypothetical protein